MAATARQTAGYRAAGAQSPPMVSPAAAVPQARQTSRLTLLEKKRTEPSHCTEDTPLGCRLRAAIDSSWFALPAERFTQGGLSLIAVVQDCSVLSGSDE